MMMWAVVLPRVMQLSCCRYDDVSCSVTACYAAFTFVQRCELLMPNVLHNSRGFHTEPLAGHIYRHPVAYVRRTIRRSIVEIEACVFGERPNIERNEMWRPCLVLFDTCDLYRLDVGPPVVLVIQLCSLLIKQITLFYNASTCFGLRVSHLRSKWKKKIYIYICRGNITKWL
jgi:hypothetical protein